jgi:hypothetical protein
MATASNLTAPGSRARCGRQDAGRRGYGAWPNIRRPAPPGDGRGNHRLSYERWPLRYLVATDFMSCAKLRSRTCSYPRRSTGKPSRHAASDWCACFLRYGVSMLITSSASTADLFDAFEGDYLIARTNEGASSDVEAWLRRCRGWPDKWLFNLFPTDVHWWWAVPQPADLVYLIGMKYEFGLPTDGTFRAEAFRACDDGFVADHRAVFLSRDELDEHERKRRPMNTSRESKEFVHTQRRYSVASSFRLVS